MELTCGRGKSVLWALSVPEIPGNQLSCAHLTMTSGTAAMASYGPSFTIIVVMLKGIVWLSFIIGSPNILCGSCRPLSVLTGGTINLTVMQKATEKEQGAEKEGGALASEPETGGKLQRQGLLRPPPS